jgi:hypothetical protein
MDSEGVVHVTSRLPSPGKAEVRQADADVGVEQDLAVAHDGRGSFEGQRPTTTHQGGGM